MMIINGHDDDYFGEDNDDRDLHSKFERFSFRIFYLHIRKFIETFLFFNDDHLMKQQRRRPRQKKILNTVSLVH